MIKHKRSSLVYRKHEMSDLKIVKKEYSEGNNGAPS